MLLNKLDKEETPHGTKDFNFYSYHHTLNYNYEITPHWHDEYEIMYNKENTLRLTVDGLSYQLEKNQAILIDKYCLHSLTGCIPSTGLGLTCFLFGDDFLFPDQSSFIYKDFLAKIRKPRYSLTQILSGENPLHAESFNLIQKLDSLRLSPKENALSIQISLLSILNNLIKTNSYTKTEHNNIVQNKNIKEALLYIEHNYIKAIKINDLANSMHMNTDYFIQVFKSYVGMTPKSYIKKLRMKHVLYQMQVHPDKKLFEIAYDSGFDDYNYFSRVFKNEFGISPTEYIKVSHSK